MPASVGLWIACRRGSCWWKKCQIRPHALSLGCIVPKAALVLVMKGVTPFFRKEPAKPFTLCALPLLFNFYQLFLGFACIKIIYSSLTAKEKVRHGCSDYEPQLCLLLTLELSLSVKPFTVKITAQGTAQTVVPKEILPPVRFPSNCSAPPCRTPGVLCSWASLLPSECCWVGKRCALLHVSLWAALSGMARIHKRNIIWDRRAHATAFF